MQEQLQLGAVIDPQKLIEARVLRLIYPHRAGDEQPWPIPEEARALLGELRWHMGRHSAIRIEELQGRLKMSAREIKDAARTLVVEFAIPVAGARTAPYGYYIAISADELKHARQGLENEIVQMARRVRALSDEHYMTEFLGQIPVRLAGTEEEK